MRVLSRVRVALRRPGADNLLGLAAWSSQVKQVDEREISLTLPNEERAADLNAWLVGQGLRVYALSHQFSLEDLFLQVMEGAPTAEETAS